MRGRNGAVRLPEALCFVAAMAMALCACKMAAASDVLEDEVGATAEERTTLFEKKGENEYVFKTNEAGYMHGGAGCTLWSLVGQDEEGKAVDLKVRMSKAYGNRLAGYGVVFRAGGGRMLCVLINNSRQYAVGTVQAGRYEGIRTWTEFPYLKAGYGQENEVWIAERGKRYAVRLNGEEACTFSDTTEAQSGRCGWGYAAVVSPYEDFPAVPVEVSFKKE